MGGKGGGSNSAMVAMQQQQAEQARQKEIQRSARLTSGQRFIDELFNGRAKGAQLLDLSKVAELDPNAGSRYGGRSIDTDARLMDLDGGYYVGRTKDNGLGAGYGVYNDKGELVSSANKLSDLQGQKIYYGGDATQREGGFGSAFYDKFKQAQLDYYQPEVQRQFNNAKFALTTGLARSGNLRSSQAGNNLSDLLYQNDVNKAQVEAKADSATGELRNSVAANRQAAINQLYSTEDPTLAANTATSLVRNVELTQPQLNPLGQLFSPIIAGIGGFAQNYGLSKAYNNPAPSADGSGRPY